MSTFKFLLDENVDPDLRKALKRRNPDLVVWCVGDASAPPRESPDPDILLWCEDHKFSLVTNNRASMPVHLQNHLASGRHVPGIFILNPNLTFGETVDELTLLWGAAEMEEYIDQLSFLPVKW